MIELQYFSIVGPKWFDLGSNSRLSSSTTKIWFSYFSFPYLKRGNYHIQFLANANIFRIGQGASLSIDLNYYVSKNGSNVYNKVNDGNPYWDGGEVEVTTTDVKHNGVVAKTGSLSFPSVSNLYLFNNSNSADGDYAIEAACGEIKFYEGDTVYGDFVPCKDNNNVVCLFDKIKNEYIYPQGNGSITAGPPVHIFSPSKSSSRFEATGGTDTFTINAETTWTAETPSIFTVSPLTGDTGETTVTITAADYTGETRQEETITFTDNDGYSFDYNIRQKAPRGAGYSTLYMGDINCDTMHFGEYEVQNIYLGETEVFSR